MAQTGYTPISIYYSATATNTPTAGNLVAGELAINTADGKLFYKYSSNVVQTIATKATTALPTTTTGSGAIVLATSATITTPIVATTIGVGGATPSASGSGVSFPATQSASSDPNTLDDYEEGTWSPSLGGSTTYLAQAGNYTKIGRVVNFKGVLYINAIGTGSTTQITGLPFAISSGSGAVCAASTYAAIATAISSMNLNVSSSTIYCQSNVIAATTNQTANAIFQNGTYLEFSGTYAV